MVVEDLERWAEALANSMRWRFLDLFLDGLDLQEGSKEDHDGWCPRGSAHENHARKLEYVESIESMYFASDDDLNLWWVARKDLIVAKKELEGSRCTCGGTLRLGG